MRTADQIHDQYTDRQKGRGQVIARMERVQQQYNGDIVVPIPEMDKEAGLYVANLLQQGLDQYARRIASVPPELECPPVNDRTETSRQRADTRRRANLSWWEASHQQTQLRRRARWLIGYAAAPVVIRPNFALGIPTWEPRNPMSAYPAPTTDPDDVRPSDMIFAVKRPLWWLRTHYPNHADGLYPRDENGDRMVTLLEYNDAEQIALAACGDSIYYTGNGQHGKATMITSMPNEAELPPALMPGRVTLDRPVGQFDGILGMLNMQQKLMALEVMAVQRGVFPDMFLVSADPNRPAKIVTGNQIHPGWTGKINEVDGGTVDYRSIQPGFQTNQTIDRIERSARIDSGTSPEFGGESSTNIRTGRRGDAVFSAQVDFAIQEAQHMLQTSMEEENRTATRIAKAYFSGRKISVYVKWKGAKGPLDYDPADFDSEYTVVSYPMAGTDVQNLTTGVGQLVGTEMMSKSTGRRLHPWIDDPELEGDLVKSEGLEQAVLQSIMAKASAGEIPANDVARISQLVTEDNMPIYKAVIQAQEEAQTRQAAMAPGPETPPGAEGVDPLSPAAQPGLALPGQGAEAGVAIPATGPSLNNLGELMRDLRATAPRAIGA